MGILNKIKHFFRKKKVGSELIVDCDSIRIALLPREVTPFVDKLRSKGVDLKPLLYGDPFESEICIVEAEVSVIDTIVSLFKSLPEGLVNRCFVPSFRLEFLKGKVVTKTAVICWAGNQIKFSSDDSCDSYVFDGESSQAIKLMEVLKQQVKSQI